MEILSDREKKLLVLLLKNTRFFQKADDLALYLGVSPRTIRNDIKNLNTVLKKHGVKILSRRGLGYKLEIENNKKFKELKDKILFDFVNFTSPLEKKEYIFNIIDQIIKDLLIGKKIFSDNLAEKLHLSLSTLKNYYPEVNKELAKFDLKLNKDRITGIQIDGREEKLRYLISERINKNRTLLDTLDHIFSKTEVKEIKKIVINILLKNNFNITDVALNNLIIHIEICIKRSTSGNLVHYLPSDKYELSNTYEFFIAKEIINSLNSELGIEISKEIFYITQHLVSSQKLNNNIMDSREYNIINQLIDEIFNDILDKTSVNFFGDQELKSNLLIHLSVALKRLRYKMNIRNDLLDKIKNDYPLAFEIAVLASNLITKRTGVNVNENEIGYIALHFEAALIRLGIGKISNISKVLIVCGTGLATASLIKERIKGIFGEKMIISKTTNLLNLNEEMINEADLVLTTVPIKQIHSEKIKVINPILSDYDLKYLKNFFINSYYDFEEELLNLFKKELFIKNLDFDDKYQLLEYITNKMVQMGYMDEKTKESIFQRERMASTELGNLLAIPHPLENDSNKSNIAVCTLKKPICWEKGKVQIVLILNISKNNVKLYESIFRVVYKFLIENFGISKILSGCEYHEFIKHLKSILEKDE